MYKKYNKHSDVINQNATVKRKHKLCKRDEQFSTTANAENEKPHKGILIDHGDCDGKHSSHYKHHNTHKSDERHHHQSRHRSAEEKHKERSKHDKTHSPVIYQHRNENVEQASKAMEDYLSKKDNCRKRHRSAHSTDNPYNPFSKKYETVHKSNTFIVDTKRSNKTAEKKDKNKDKDRISRQRSKSGKKDINKEKVSQIWYCQVETNSPFKQHKKEFNKSEETKHKKHKSLKESTTSTHGRNKSPDKQVLNALSPSIHKSRIHHFKDPTLNTIIKPKADRSLDRTPKLEQIRPKSHKKAEKSCQERPVNKKIQHKVEPSQSAVNVDQKIEDGLKMYFMKLQNIIDKKFEAILPTKEEQTENKKERKKHCHKSNKNEVVDSRQKEKEEIRVLKERYRNIPHNRKETDNNPFIDHNGIAVHKENFEKSHKFTPDIPKTHQKQRRHHSHPDNLKPKYDHHHEIFCEGHSTNAEIQTTVYDSKLDKHTATVKKRDKFAATRQSTPEEELQYRTIIRDMMNGNVISNPSTSVTYVKPPVPVDRNLNLYYYDKSSSKYIDLYNENSKEERYQYKDKENHFWVEGVEPAKRDTLQKTRKRKLTPNLQSKIVSIIGIPSQTKDHHSCNFYHEKHPVPLEDLLQNRNKMKRLKLYYKYLQENNQSSPSGSDSGRNHVPSESCKVLSDRSEPAEYLPASRDKPILPTTTSNDKNTLQDKHEDNTFINIKLDDYHFYLKENNKKDQSKYLTTSKKNSIDCQKPNKDKKRPQYVQRKIKKQIVNEVILNAKSDTDISYSSLTVKSLNFPRQLKTKKPDNIAIPQNQTKTNIDIEDITVKEFYNNIDYFKKNFEKQTSEDYVSNFQVLQFLENMHQLYMTNQQKAGPQLQDKSIEVQRLMTEDIHRGPVAKETNEININTDEDMLHKEESTHKSNLLVNKSVEACQHLQESKTFKPSNPKIDRMTSYQEILGNKHENISNYEEVQEYQQTEDFIYPNRELTSREVGDESIFPIEEEVSAKSVAVQQSYFQIPSRSSNVTDTETSTVHQSKNYEAKKCIGTSVVGESNGDTKNPPSLIDSISEIGDVKVKNVDVEVRDTYLGKIPKRNLKSLKIPRANINPLKISTPNVPKTPPTKDIPEILEQVKPSIIPLLKTRTKKTHDNLPKKEDNGLPPTPTSPTKLEDTYKSKYINQSKDDLLGKKKKRRPQSATSAVEKAAEEALESSDIFKLKKSQSEINFDQIDLIREESKITSLVCLESYENGLPTGEGSCKAHSLDRYLLSNKPIINEQAHNSTLMITKDYRSSDVSSYQKRKKYDEVIRKKMKKRMSLQEKQLSRIFEVRYLTLDDNTKNVFSNQPETLERIPESEECLNRRKAEEKFIKVTNRKYEKFLNSFKKDLDSPYSDLCEFLSKIPESQGSHRHTFNSKNKCKHCDTGKNFMNFVNYLCNSLKSKCSSTKSTEEDSVKSGPTTKMRKNRSDTKKSISRKKKLSNIRKTGDTTSSCYDDIEDNYQFPLNTKISNEHMSCPVLKTSDSSFDFLYQEETNSSDEVPKRPVNSILGFSLNSEITLTKNNQAGLESPCSETSGYASSRSKHSFSLLNFFKKPKMAALLKPQIAEGMFGGREVTSYNNKMMQECRNYAQKVKEESELKLDINDEPYEEIPLDVLLKKSNSDSSGFENSICNLNVGYSQSLPCSAMFHEPIEPKKFASDTNLLNCDKPTDFVQISLDVAQDPQTFQSQNTAIDLLLQQDSDDQYSLLEKMIDSEIYLTNLSSCSIMLVESLESIQSNQKKAFKDGTHCSAEIKRLIAKKFFENILEMYENEAAISSALFEDDEFVEKKLMAFVRDKRREKKKTIGCRFKKVWKKAFSRKEKFVVEEVFTSQNIEKPELVENEYQKKLQALAHSARRYFSSLVQAVAVNNKMDDEMKMYGILRLLEAIEKGQFMFLRKFASSQQKEDIEREIKDQVWQTFTDVYSSANNEADKCRRKLSNNDAKLMAAFVCKYRMGLLSRTDIVASYLGKGFFQDENQLKAAVTFLLKTTNDVNLQEFEDYCGKH
ncbi:unnamed protein product [Psylliodes chrysocephalus]|uniref:Uncharacterized protein n=1 Tax=Psylliodes chrysocephalus TaxID=3402493 RepID=A0A9P0G9C9_9CUCU|nr:unnamed protein product [Psylliodes chrysocephala]